MPRRLFDGAWSDTLVAMTKPWPKKLPKKDPHPSDFSDLSVETQRVVLLGEHVYFFVWCQDMDEFNNQLSVLFRAPIAFDRPAERVATIRSEIVDLLVHDGKLVALENGTDDDGGFGVAHRLAPGKSVPESSARFEVGKVFKALGHGPAGGLIAVGNAVQRFDRNAWAGTKVPNGIQFEAVASNGQLTVAVGSEGAVFALDDGMRKIELPSEAIADFGGVYVDRDGIVSLAGGDVAWQGPIERILPLEGSYDAMFNDCCVFQGKHYWSAVGGLYMQNGKKLELVFDGESCFRLTPTDRHLFVASEAGVLRWDGEEWKALNTDYDEDASVWVVRPGPVAPDLEEDEDEDDGEA